MINITTTIILNVSLQKVWERVVSLEAYTWRSDIQKIEVINDQKFIEVDNSNYETTFIITCKDKQKRYEFTIENSNMKGQWSGDFNVKDGKTYITFNESVTAKKWYLKPFIRFYLKLQQKKYIQDLKASFK